jgi:hypothetical protein
VRRRWGFGMGIGSGLRGGCVDAAAPDWPGVHPDGEPHLVMDNYAAHERPEIRDWPARNARVLVHPTPTSAS